MIVEGATVKRINNSKTHEYIENLRLLKRPGLVLFQQELLEDQRQFCMI